MKAVQVQEWIGANVHDGEHRLGTIIKAEPPSPNSQGRGYDLLIEWGDGTRTWCDAGDLFWPDAIA